MVKNSRAMIYGVIPLLIFGVAFIIRRVFFCGFVLGDDLEEFSLLQYLQKHGPFWNEQLHARFGVWLFHLLFLNIFGATETGFFLPTWLMSSSFSVFAYFLFLNWRFSIGKSVVGGLLIASAPYEVLMGSIHSNDLILSWVLGLSLLCFFILKNRPVLSGFLIGIFLWFGFYVKLWVVYVFPILGIYFLYQGFKNKKWAQFVSFFLVSAILHLGTVLFWKLKVGVFLPFISKHAASYHWSELAETLGDLFLQYPRMLFIGSELNSTYFGGTVYFWLILVLIKMILTMGKTIFQKKFVFDSIDYSLLFYFGTFFLFINFFPNSFKFDQYYSAPRIFRYLLPISFPLTLHLSKLILDLLVLLEERRIGFQYAGFLAVVLIMSLNIFHAADATEPGRNQRGALLDVVNEIKQRNPPQVIAEYWIGNFIREVYLKDGMGTILMPYMVQLNYFKTYEEWLDKNQKDLPEGTMLITGLGSYVYYGAHYDGFRLNFFSKELHPGWKPVSEFRELAFLPDPEPARLWEWRQTGPAPPSPEGDSAGKGTSENKDDMLTPEDPEELFKKAMEHFDQGKCLKGQRYFEHVFTSFAGTQRAGDARYFYSICFFRNGLWDRTITEFRGLLQEYPEINWAAGANYHIGLSYAFKGDKKKAREYFNIVINRFSTDTSLVNLAKGELERLD